MIKELSKLLEIKKELEKLCIVGNDTRADDNTPNVLNPFIPSVLKFGHSEF